MDNTETTSPTESKAPDKPSLFEKLRRKIKPKIKENKPEPKNDANKTFFLPERVDKRRDKELKLRLRTLISAKGLSEADFYHSIGMSKHFWFRISWGMQECPLDLKVRISQSLGTDSSVIWLPKEEAKHD